MPLSIEKLKKGLDSIFQGKEQELHLSVSISDTEVSLACLHLNTSTFVHTSSKSYEGLPELESLLELLSPFAHGSKGCTVIYNGDLFSLVPKALFKEESSAHYLKFSKAFDPNLHHILHRNLETQSAVCVFAVPVAIQKLLSKYLPGKTTNHQMNSLVESFGSKSQLNADQVFMQVYDQKFDLVFFKNKKLQFSNRFDFQSAEDFIYFTLYAFEQLKLNTEQIEVYLSGKLSQESKVYDLLFTYIRNIRFLSLPENLQLNSDLQSQAEHLHFDLYHHYLCE